MSPERPTEGPLEKKIFEGDRPNVRDNKGKALSFLLKLIGQSPAAKAKREMEAIKVVEANRKKWERFDLPTEAIKVVEGLRSGKDKELRGWVEEADKKFPRYTLDDEGGVTPITNDDDDGGSLVTVRVPKKR